MQTMFAKPRSGCSSNSSKLVPVAVWDLAVASLGLPPFEGAIPALEFLLDTFPEDAPDPVVCDADLPNKVFLAVDDFC